MRVHPIQVPLSKLHPCRKNPRRGKPSAEAHQRMVASVRAVGLLSPLVIRPVADAAGEYEVIAGNRRLAALRQVYRQDDPKIACIVRDVDDPAAEALALSENFVREDMHPLDEAESFARLAADEAKGPDGIAGMFGVTERYVRQRMKLAGLAKVVKTALRDGQIDLGVAEAFASIPEDRQTAVWDELDGHPRHAEQVRSVINNAWIDAKHALFDLSTLPDWKVSRDLFSERVLVEREAFMAAQAEALQKQKAGLVEDGWREVICLPYEEIVLAMSAMELPGREFDPQTQTRLNKLLARRIAWDAKYEALPEDDTRSATAIESKIEALDAKIAETQQSAREFHSEATKAIGTAFLALLPDGQVRREHRVPRTTPRRATLNDAPVEGVAASPTPPTSDDLNERQLADVFTHLTLAVREALLKAPAVRKRVLALILHEKVRGEALAVRHEANAVTLHASRDGGPKSEPFQRLKEKRTGIDPFAEEFSVDEAEAFERLCGMSDAQVSQLIDVLVAELVTAHLQRPTELIEALGSRLKVELRHSWTPDAGWLAHYQKVQLAHLLGRLKGPVYSPAHEVRKKSELVDAAASLFQAAGAGKLDDKIVADRVAAWLPSVLRQTEVVEDGPVSKRT